MHFMCVVLGQSNFFGVGNSCYDLGFNIESKPG